MRYVAYATAGVVLLAALVYGVLRWLVRRGMASRDAAVLARLEPVTRALSRGTAPADPDVRHLAALPLTRNRLYEALEAAGRAELFPRELATADRFAEADLAYWLAHPNELGQAPDAIELIGRFPRALPSGGTGEFFVFKFRVNAPHWKASDGWLAGVAGPYPAGATTPTHAERTFSRFDPVEARTPEGHLEACLQATGGGPG